MKNQSTNSGLESIFFISGLSKSAAAASESIPKGFIASGILRAGEVVVSEALVLLFTTYRVCSSFGLN